MFVEVNVTMGTPKLRPALLDASLCIPSQMGPKDALLLFILRTQWPLRDSLLNLVRDLNTG